MKAIERVRQVAPGRISAAFLAVLALAFAGASWRLGYFSAGQPGPGLLPAAAGVLLFPIAVLLVRAPLEPGDEHSLAARSLGGLALLGACCVTMPWAGVVLPSFATAALWMRLLHGRPAVISMLSSALLCAAFIWGFVALLKVPLPLWPELQ